jgi:hypothetical protein
MLDAQQYAAIGKIAVGCSRIEYLMRYFAAHYVGAPEFGIANSVIDKFAMFRPTKEAFERVLNAIASEYPALQAKVQAVRARLTEADKLAQTRNILMHGLVEPDPITKKPTMYGRKPLSCDQTELDGLASEVTKLYDLFCDECGALLEDLSDERAKLIKPI